VYDPLSVAAYCTSLFPARSDVYSRWTPDGWRPLREPLTPEVYLAGLTGKGPSISGYMIAPPGVAHQLAVDFDGADGYARALSMADLMWSVGMPAYIETSRRGAHLWGLLSDVRPASVIRYALYALIQALGWPHDDPKVELRPGSDHVGPDGLGHALRMPLMPHPKTGKRGVMIAPPTRRPMGPSMALVALCMWDIRSTLIDDWAERYKPPPVTHVPSKHRSPHIPYPEDDGRASDILREMWGVPNARPGRTCRCPAHDDKMASLSVLKDDKRVICKAPHCPLNNGDHGRGTYELRQMAHDGR
jgi:hypothetical protein